MITDKEADILAHASRNDGRYVTSDPLVLEMAERGLMTDFGPWALAGGDHALRVTYAGRKALCEWYAAQPIPKVKKRRVSRAFECWKRYCDAFGHFPFSRFWREIWPTYQFR